MRESRLIGFNLSDFGLTVKPVNTRRDVLLPSARQGMVSAGNVIDRQQTTSFNTVKNGASQVQMQRQIGGNLSSRLSSLNSDYLSGKLSQQDYDTQFKNASDLYKSTVDFRNRYGGSTVLNTAQKRQMVRDQKRQAIVDSYQAGLGSGASLTSDPYLTASLNNDLNALDTKYAVDDLRRQQKDTADQARRDQTKTNLAANPAFGPPENPMRARSRLRGESRLQRLGLVPPAKPTPTSTPPAPAPGKAPPIPGTGGTATPPPAGSPPAAGAPPSPSNPLTGPLDAPTTVDQIAAQESAVTDPVLSALDKSRTNAQDAQTAEQKLLDARGQEITDYTSGSKANVELTKAAKVKQAQEDMNLASDLQDESLARGRRDEELAYQEIQQKNEREEQDQIKKNAENVSRARTSLGARYGGFGSGAGMKKIQEAQDEGDRIVRQIREEGVQAATEHRNRLDDLETNWRLGMKGIINDRDKAVSDALSEARSEAQAIDDKALEEDGTKMEKAIDLARRTYDKLDSIDQATGQALSDHNKNVLTQRDKLRGEMYNRKQAALSTLTTLIGDKDVSADGVVFMLKQMRDLGMDIGGINPDNITLEQINKLKQGAAAERFKPGQYRDSTGYSLGDEAMRVTARLGAENATTQRETAFGLLEAGDIEGYKLWRDGLAYAKMDAAQRKDVDSAGDTLRAVSEARKTLTTFDDGDKGGVLKAFIESKKPFTNNFFSVDQRFVKLKAQIEADQSNIRNKIFGAALSPQEKVLAENFTIDFTKDNYETMKTKLDNMERLANDVRETRFRSSWGDFSIPTTSSPSTSALSTDDADSFLKGGSPWTTPAAGSGAAMRTDRNNNPTAFTTDLARQAGLAEGVDYEQGDAFPNNPNVHTARLLGDPVAQTIKAIDAVGFYTQSGAQRWTHTAMSKQDWDALSYNQKADIVRKMYQREGGTALASLFPTSNNG